ncbi:MAG: uncharacterized protein JWO77_1946 [Ilumatobacteraceae bacterium]|nr:uncharacterized protein [Ilumatobacteraceae bacterium]
MRWEYEPHTFVLERGEDGSTTWAFSPDFYLPDHGRYIEVTTLNQKLVTKKNGKVRKLREVQPLIDIALLYQRDYLSLLVRYGLEAPEQLADFGDEVQVATEPLGLLGLGTLHMPVDEQAVWRRPAAG